MIRDATAEDADYFVGAAVEYFRETDERRYLTLDPARFREWYLAALSSGELIALVDDARRGHVVGVIVPSIWNHAESLARVVSLWVVPEHRGGALAARLLRAFEDRAGAARAVMVDTNDAFSPARVGRFYERRGYRPVSQFYVKENIWAQQRQS